MNGYANGHAPPELQQDTAFLFTSESVGEGHPGERSRDHPRGDQPLRRALSGDPALSEELRLSSSLYLSLSLSLSHFTSPCTLQLSYHHYHHYPAYAAMKDDRLCDPEGSVLRFFLPLHSLPRNRISIDANRIFSHAFR